MPSPRQPSQSDAPDTSTAPDANRRPRPGALERLQSEMGWQEKDSADGVGSLRMEGTSALVADAMARGAKAGEYVRGGRQAFAEVEHLLPESIRTGGQVSLSGREAAELLERVIPHMCARGEEIFGRALPAWEWLWMIRRTPLTHIWNDHASMAVRAYMAALALGSNNTLATIPTNGIVKVGERHSRRLAFVSGYAGIVAMLTMGYRVIGKGGSIVLLPDTATVKLEYPDQATRERVLLYDERVVDEGAFGGFGVHIPELRRDSLATSGAGPLGMVFTRLKPRWNENGAGGVARLERFGQHFAQLDAVFAVLEDENAPSALQLDAELGALVCLAATYAIACESKVLDPTNVMQVGYSLHLDVAEDIEETRIGESMRKAVAWAQPRLPRGATPETATELWKRLRDMRPSMWPLRQGPIVFPVANNAIVIDWAAGTARLLHALRYPKVSGETANVRGRAFETSVRAAIGETPFAPEPWLAELQGRHLQLDGLGAFGEIDAAASIPGANVHLILSCKSYTYSEAYERGDHREVRNISDRLRDDAVALLEFALALKRNPMGRNYKIPEGAHLVPVLVTPRVMWSAHPVCWERIVNWDEWPPLACGVVELLSYLDRIHEPEEAAARNEAVGHT